MAGQPKKQRIMAELQRRASTDLGDDATPLDYAVAWVEGGKTLQALADDVGKTLGVTVWRGQLVELVYATVGEGEAERRLSRARARGAHSLADGALMQVDGVREDRDAIAAAKLKADVRLRIAAAWNREAYGEQRGTQVSISFNDLHLQAMRARAVPSASEQRLLESAPADDAEVVVEDVQVLDT